MALEPLLDELLTRAKDILRVDTVAILLLDDDAQELVARAAKGLEEEVERGVRIPVGRGLRGPHRRGPQADLHRRRRPRRDPEPDPAHEGRALAARRSAARRGRGARRAARGHVTPREFTNADAALLQLAAAQAAPAIDRARLFDALDREHRNAVALQRSLLPDRLPDLVGIDTAARYLPARDEVGGDWYDVIDLPGGHIGLAIGDVAGHGLRAASLMGQLRAGLRAYALEGHSPGETLKRLDRMLQTISGRGMATAGYAIVDPTRATLRYAAAGHPPPVLVRRARRAT